MSERANTVVVGVDGSANSMTGLKWAQGYAKATGANLRLVTTWTWPVSYGAPVTYDGYLPDNDALAVLEKARAELDLDPSRVESVCKEGYAGLVLVAESEDAELLVVGSHGHSVVSTVLLGSVSGYCVHHASCPVVVAR